MQREINDLREPAPPEEGSDAATAAGVQLPNSSCRAAAMPNPLFQPLPASAYLGAWLRGTTCSRAQHEVVGESATHVALKHHGHTSYVDRVVGSCRCPTYVAFLPKTGLTQRDLFYGSGAVKVLEGRVTASQVAATLAELAP